MDFLNLSLKKIQNKHVDLQMHCLNLRKRKLMEIE